AAHVHFHRGRTVGARRILVVGDVDLRAGHLDGGSWIRETELRGGLGKLGTRRGKGPHFWNADLDALGQVVAECALQATDRADDVLVCARWDTLRKAL